jgi:hypothetical protein
MSLWHARTCAKIWMSLLLWGTWYISWTGIGAHCRCDRSPPPRPLISTLVYSGIGVSLTFTVDCSIHPIGTLNLTAESSVYLTGRTDCSVCLVWFAHWILLLIFVFEIYMAHGACDLSARMIASPWHLIPSGISRGPCLLYSQICISYRSYQCSLFMLFQQKVIHYCRNQNWSLWRTSLMNRSTTWRVQVVRIQIWDLPFVICTLVFPISQSKLSTKLELSLA